MLLLTGGFGLLASCFAKRPVSVILPVSDSRNGLGRYVYSNCTPPVSVMDNGLYVNVN